MFYALIIIGFVNSGAVAHTVPFKFYNLQACERAAGKVLLEGDRIKNAFCVEVK